MTKKPAFTFDDPNKRNASKLEAISYACSEHIDPGMGSTDAELIDQIFRIIDDGQTGKDIATVLGYSRPVEIVEVVDRVIER